MKPVRPLLTAVTLATPLRAGITRAEKPIRFGQRCTVMGTAIRGNYRSRRGKRPGVAKMLCGELRFNCCIL